MDATIIQMDEMQLEKSSFFQLRAANNSVIMEQDYLFGAIPRVFFQPPFIPDLTA